MKNPICFVIPLLLLVACEEEDELLGFVNTSGSASEAEGTQTLTINLGKKATSSITITYIVGGTASVDGDFRILSNTSFTTDASSSFTLTVPEGSSSASLTFELIDDIQVEPVNESIYFQITGISDSDLIGSIQHLQYIFKVEDNDVAPTNGLQVDLTWNLGDGVSINNANFDLYLARNVQLNNEGDIISMELVDQVLSTNTKGFETIVINDSIADDEYYVIVRFVKGTLTANVFLHLSHDEDYEIASGRVTTDFVGEDIYYGPIAVSR
jgi:hypothetical protein